MIDNPVFQRFQTLAFDKEAIGLAPRREDEPYFCTPVGAEIIGWLGVDGIHFCFIPSISNDMVFAVSPTPCGQHHVEPMARSFEEFLSLVLCCKGAGPLEQICWMDEERFLELLKAEEEIVWPKRDTALEVLRAEFAADTPENPYQSVKRLQAEFDYSKIPFSKEYYELLQTETD